MSEDRWVLTDNEIIDIIGEDRWNHASNGRAEFKMMAVVQDAKTKRKLVEWIDSMGEYSPGFQDNTFKISNDDWQALRMEVGLGE